MPLRDSQDEMLARLAAELGAGLQIGPCDRRGDHRSDTRKALTASGSCKEGGRDSLLIRGETREREKSPSLPEGRGNPASCPWFRHMIGPCREQGTTTNDETVAKA